MKYKTVLVGMSGGVDSAVAALKLKMEGYAVIGITMKYLPETCAASHYNEAARIAELLDIPHSTIDVSQQFQRTVVDNFRMEYLNGRTPNPCIRCNKLMKFDLLLAKLSNYGAECIATGHYARIVQDENSGRCYLKRAQDAKKDQSYFLYLLTQEILQRTIFPLGELSKEDVRDIARKHMLPISEKSESQEICFVEGKDYRPLFNGISKPGPIVDRNGTVLGTHTGIVDYTLGQRRRLRISGRKPLYVLKIEPESNTIVAGEQKYAYHDMLVCGEINWIAEPASGPMEVTAKIRSLHPVARATLHPMENGRIRLKFSEPQWAITPGQSAVFYDGDTVIGGGIIEASEKSD
jgi:tRNA-specific 2-thiouridylase